VERVEKMIWDQRWGFYSLVCVVAAAFSLILTGGESHVAILVLLSLMTLPLIFYYAGSITPHLTVVVFISLFLFDDPSANPFHEILVFTERIGGFIYIPLRRFTPLPSPFSLLEICAVAGAFWSIMSEWREDFRLRALRRNWNVVGLPVLLMFIWGWFLCLLRGQDVQAAMFQSRTLIIYPCFGLIGWRLSGDAAGLWRIFKCLAAVALIKAIQTDLIWYFEYHLEGETTRYVIDHYYSDGFVGALLVIWASLAEPSRRILVTRAALRILASLPILIALYLNNRRTAYIGLVISSGIIPMFLFRQLAREYRKYVWLIGAGFLAALSLMFGYKLITANGSYFNADGSAMYRVNENLNLLEMVRMRYLTGSGFGVPMPNPHGLPDISRFYKEFLLLPHNTLLFTWGFLGPIGMFMLFEKVRAGLRAANVYATSGGLNDRIHLVVGILAASQLIRWLVYLYADMGLIENRFAILVCFSIGYMARHNHLREGHNHGLD
jgi:hypothetical protein